MVFFYILLALQLLFLWSAGFSWWASIVVLSSGVLFFARRRLSNSHLLLAFFLLVSASILFRPEVPRPAVLPEPELLHNFHESMTLDRYMDQELLDKAVRGLETPDPKIASPVLLNLFEGLEIEPYISLTLLNLNLEPVCWKGALFVDQYNGLVPNQPKLKLVDDRLFFIRLVPVPDAREVQGYVVIEALLLSLHERDFEKTWLGFHYPEYRDFEPIVVDNAQTGILSGFVKDLGLNGSMLYDFSFIPRLRNNDFKDFLAAVWTVLMLTAFLSIRRMWATRNVWLLFVGYLMLLVYPSPFHLDYMTSFGSHIFGFRMIGAAFISPVHLFLTGGVVYLILFCVSKTYFRGNSYWSCLLFLLFCLLLAVAPNQLQQHTSFSFVHPLEAFTSVGAFLTFIAFLLTFAYMGLLLEDVSDPPIPVKVVTVVSACLISGAYDPYLLLPSVSLSLVWMLKTSRSPAALVEVLRAALLLLAFYPLLVVREQEAEVAFIKRDLLDEITLLSERNHFRMGRIIHSLEHLIEAIEEKGAHENLMTLFAAQCGLFHDGVDFALTLSDAAGDTISLVDQHISLERVPYLLGREDRIETYRQSKNHPMWMIYRKTLETHEGVFDFGAVLANDYQNISLVRQLRNVSLGRSSTAGPMLTPYFAYIFDVFNLDGEPVYSPGTPNPMEAEAGARLNEMPYFWEIEGRNTVFYFKDHSYLYRITHKATPLKMVLVRFLSFLLTLLIIMKTLRFSLKWRRNIFSRWNRSFALKMAVLMFLGSVVPTSALGYLLINSIRGNQQKEEDAFARLKILGTRNLFKELGRMQRESDPFSRRRILEMALGSNANLQEEELTEEPMVTNPKLLPVQELSRLLGEDLSLFISGSLLKTNQPEIFSAGILDRRLGYSLAKNLIIDKKTYMLQRVPTDEGQNLLVAFSPINLGENHEAVLAMTMIPSSQRQRLRWQEQIEFSFSVLFGLLFLMAGLARFMGRNVLRPVAAITRSASRMARGLDNKPIVVRRNDELKRMVDAFNTMQSRIQRSQQQLWEQLRIIDETLKSMSSGLLGCNGERQILIKNPKVLEVLGFEPDNFPETLDELAALYKGLEPLTALLDRGEFGEFNFHPVSKGEDKDREILVKLRTVPVQEHGNNNIQYIVVFEDITYVLTANRFKAWSEMARRVAHEIKNPLTPIALEIDHVMRLYQDQHPQFGDALQESADEIKTQIEHLRHIATEFSDYARPIQIEPRPTNLSELIEGVLGTYRKTSEALEVRTDLDEELVLNIDARLLRRTFHNLVVNAVQAMDGEGLLRVRLFTEADSAVIWVEDSGPGIPEKDHKRIFEAYFSTKDQGSGLGMVIAKKYVDLHKGTIGVDRTYQDGTRMVITLPLKS